MLKTLIATTFLTFALGAGSIYAQNSDNGGGQMRWDRQTGEAFFTLRSDEEIRTNFESLSAEQQATVRDDCIQIKDRNTTNTKNSRTSFIDQSIVKVCEMVEG